MRNSKVGMIFSAMWHTLAGMQPRPLMITRGIGSCNVMYNCNPKTDSIAARAYSNNTDLYRYNIDDNDDNDGVTNGDT